MIARRWGIRILLAAALPLGCRSAGPPRAPEFFASPDSAAASLPFSEAVRGGDFLFVSGQIGNAPGRRELVPGGVGPEAEQALRNIQAILERHGASMDDVVKCTVFLADIREWPAFNEVYVRHFPRHFPARSALASDGLVLGARVELECIAYAPARARD